MEKPKIVLDPFARRVEWIFSDENYERLTSAFDVLWGKNETMPQEEFDKVRDELFAVITGRWRYGPVSDMGALKAIIEVSGTPPSREVLDYETCFHRGIRVLSCAPVFGPAVAEMALGLALASARGIVEADSLMRAGQEQYSRKGNARNFSLYGQTVGIVGFGGLARCLKPLLDPFHPRYLVYDPWLTQSFLRRYNVESADLDTVLSEARLIFVMGRPTPENKGMISREKMELIRSDAVFLVMSRAHLVDFDALLDMAGAGRFKVATDVYPEQPVPQDHPVRRSTGTILTPHIAGHIREIYGRLGTMVLDDLLSMRDGLPPRELQVVEREIVARL
jgi:phosphoglycerate dehydrogenase-like enzyme